MAERYGSEWHGRRLVLAGQRVLAHWPDWQDGRIDRATMLEHIEPERQRIQTLLAQGSTGRWVHKNTRGVCKNLLAHEAAMWRFLAEPDLPPTNNLAERALRRPVIWRKTSFGTDSADGSRFAERCLTAIATLRAQNRDPFAFFVAAHRAHVAGQTPPSLLPVEALPT